MDLKQNIFIASVVFAIGLLLSGCNGNAYDVQMNYNCVQFTGTDAGGYSCLEWEQTGGISTPSCFPGEASVITKSGPRFMNELRIGDEILGFDHVARQSIFSPVRAWLHRSPEKEVMMKRIEADGASIVASGMHSVALQGTEDYEFAGYLTPEKDVLMTPDGSGAKVKKLSSEFAKGLFSPLTGTSNFYVSDGVGKSVLAHSFAQLKKPRRYERIFHKLVDVGEFFWPGLNDVSTEDYVHPIAHILMRLLGVSVVETPMIRRRLQTASGFQDIGVPFEDSAEGRRLRNYGSGFGAAAGSSESNRQNQELMIVLTTVIETMPPFIGYALSAPHTPAPVAHPRSVNVAEWLAHGEKMNTVYAIVYTAIFVCLTCCYFCASLAEGTSRGADLSRGSSRSVSASRHSLAEEDCAEEE